MKVLIAGNLANMGYEIAKALRERNIDVKLLLPKYPSDGDDPKNMYPELEKSGYPDWLVRFDNHNRSFSLNNWKFQVLREMRKKEYNIIIAMTEFPIFATFSGKPFGVYSTGSDMRELYFEKSLKGWLYRFAYKKAKIVIWGDVDKLPLLKKLKINNKAMFATAPRHVKIFPKKIPKGDLENKFIIFHPTSQNWRLKQNQKFLKAYNKFCQSRDNVYLILSHRGPDLEKALKILNNDTTKGKFETIPFVNANKLQYYYNLADVIVDQFSIGSFGMITVEAMMCRKPILLTLDEEIFKQCYKEIPGGLINTNTEEGILKALNDLEANLDLREKLGNKNFEWVNKYWNTEVLTENIITICKKILNKK